MSITKSVVLTEAGRGRFPLLALAPCDAELGVVQLSSAGTIVAVDESAERLLGMAAAHAIGRTLEACLDRTARDTTRGGVHPDPDTDGWYTGQACRSDIRVSRSRLTTDQGVVELAVLSTTPRECDLVNEVRKLATLVEQTGDAVLITDGDGVVEYVNRAFEATIGYGRHEVIGKRPQMLQSGLHDREFYGRLWRTIRSGQVFRDVFINRKKNGELIYEEKTISPIKDRSGVITHFVSTAKDVTKRVMRERKLRYLAEHDRLTGLPNRGLLFARLQDALHAGTRSDNSVAVLYLDLDGFKGVNDRLGHDAGDELLCMAAQRIRECIRHGDTLARFGGDEFVMVVRDLVSGDAGVRAIADKILRAFGEPFAVRGHALKISVSIGVCLAHSGETDSLRLVNKADTAMYEAKGQGKNRCAFYDERLEKKAGCA